MEASNDVSEVFTTVEMGYASITNANNSNGRGKAAVFV